MKITVIGWYGTETIGDRAILAGLNAIFSRSFGKYELNLASLYPFFSKGTVVEDLPFWKELEVEPQEVTVFDSKNVIELHRAIKDSSLLVVGGGPLMDLDEMFYLEAAVRKAKQLGVKTALLGCGIGPLNKTAFMKCLVSIAKNSDLIILRDLSSLKALEELFPRNKAISLIDPAAICVHLFRQSPHFINESGAGLADENSSFVVNVRKFPIEYIAGNSSTKRLSIHNFLKSALEKIAKANLTERILLLPMHYFHIGDDDRFYMNLLLQELTMKNIMVQNIPLNLKQTLLITAKAKFAAGMRFHSVLFQTLLCGRNYILNYTHSTEGKIPGFIEQIAAGPFYLDRIIALQDDSLESMDLSRLSKPFPYPFKFVDEAFSSFCSELQYLMKGGEASLLK